MLANHLFAKRLSESPDTDTLHLHISKLASQSSVAAYLLISDKAAAAVALSVHGLYGTWLKTRQSG